VKDYQSLGHYLYDSQQLPSGDKISASKREGRLFRSGLKRQMIYFNCGSVAPLFISALAAPIPKRFAKRSGKLSCAE
jgi:hypothetical protein